jgi:hypothetical protein
MGVSDTARERAVVWHVRKEDVHKGSARDVDPPFASFDVVLYRDYEALLAEREALRKRVAALEAQLDRAGVPVAEEETR